MSPYGSQVITAGFLVLFERLPALLGHLVQYRQDAGIIQFDALIDLFLLDGSRDEAQYTEALLFTGAHGLLHVVLDLFFQTHKQRVRGLARTRSIRFETRIEVSTGECDD